MTLSISSTAHKPATSCAARRDPTTCSCHPLPPSSSQAVIFCSASVRISGTRCTARWRTARAHTGLRHRWHLPHAVALRAAGARPQRGGPENRPRCACTAAQGFDPYGAGCGFHGLSGPTPARVWRWRGLCPFQNADASGRPMLAWILLSAYIGAALISGNWAVAAVRSDCDLRLRRK